MIVRDFRVHQNVIDENNNKSIKETLEDSVYQVLKVVGALLTQKASQITHNTVLSTSSFFTFSR